MLSIETALTEDRGPVLQLWELAGLGQSSEVEWRALLSEACATVLVAREEDGSVVGTAVTSFDGWRAYIYHLVVQPERRHAGIGQALMAHAERRLTRAGARQIYISVHGDNVAGFAVAGGRGYLPNGDVQLVKVLDHEAHADPLV